MLIFGRILALGGETTDICAIVRPKLHAHCAEKTPLCPLKSGRNLVLDEETKDFYANIRPISRNGRRNHRYVH